MCVCMPESNKKWSLTGKGGDKVERTGMTTNFTHKLFYIALTLKPYINLKTENKLRQINLIVYQTGNMTTKRKKKKDSSKCHLNNVLTLYPQWIYSKRKRNSKKSSDILSSETT